MNFSNIYMYIVEINYSLLKVSAAFIVTTLVLKYEICRRSALLSNEKLERLLPQCVPLELFNIFAKSRQRQSYDFCNKLLSEFITVPSPPLKLKE